MPAPGYHYRRNNIITKELYTNFVKQHKIDIDYHTFKQIILDSNQVIFDIIANEAEGFKIPENMGYWVVTKYKATKKALDWKNSKKYKKAIYHTNLHSFGYTSHLKWCKFSIARFRFSDIYKFKGARFLTRKISENTQAGMIYFKWENSDFWSASKLDRLYNRKYKNEEQ